MFFTEFPDYNLHYADGMLFTTFDRDQDQYGDNNCGQLNHCGWWYNNCAYANANGQYAPGTHSYNAMHYYAFLRSEGLVATKLMFK